MPSVKLCRILLTAVLCAGAGPSSAQGPADAYLAARDAAIAKIKARDDAGGETTDAQTAQDTRVLQRLEDTLRRIVGPVRVAGFSANGKANLSTLSSGDIGFGALDAMQFEGQGGKAYLYVTTEGLLANWLKAHRKWWNDQASMPQQPAEALGREAFYTQAISSDAAVILYKALPTTKPGGVDVATAQLQAATQDQPPPLPDELLVSVIRGGKLFIVQAPLKTQFATIPPCEARRIDYDKRVDKLTKVQSGKAGGATAEAAGEAVTKLMNEASADAVRCFKDHAANEPAFLAASRQAQALIDQLAKP